MHSLSTRLPIDLHVVTEIAQKVSHGHHRATHSRHGGSLGTSNTFLVAPKAQRRGGKHRAVTA
jgi:hypothetical protein